MIAYPDCKKEISSRAKTCPHCGAPTKASVNSGGRMIARTVVLLIAIFAGVLAYGNRGDSRDLIQWGVCSGAFFLLWVVLNFKK